MSNGIDYQGIFTERFAQPIRENLNLATQTGSFMGTNEIDEATSMTPDEVQRFLGFIRDKVANNLPEVGNTLYLEPDGLLITNHGNGDYSIADVDAFGARIMHIQDNASDGVFLGSADQIAFGDYDGLPILDDNPQQEVNGQDGFAYEQPIGERTREEDIFKRIAL